MKKTTANLFVVLYCIAAFPVFGGDAINVGTPTATSTFECIGVELPFAGDDDRDAFCDIQFRESGTTRWNVGLRMYADHYTDRTGFRGSIVHLEPGKAYDISLNYSDPDGGSGKQEINASTWSETFPQGDIVQVKSQNRPLEVESGSPGAYRVYDGARNRAVVDVNDARYCVNTENKSYIILRNITFRDSDDHAIRIMNSNHVVIEDCEIVNWGRPGVYIKDQTPHLKHAGVQIESGEQIIVQHCSIHDPRGTARDWSTRHPIGPRGIYFMEAVRHSVFRYNRISGDKDHYYQDILTGGSRGPGSDVDIYGNELSHTWDDGIEIEGNNINVRLWNNVVHHAFMGVAADNNDHTFYGPTYIWRNLFTDLYIAPDKVKRGNAFKLSNEVGRGGIYIFNNTLLGTANHNAPQRVITNGPIFNLIAYNNIFDVAGFAYDDHVQAGSFFDCNGYSHGKEVIEHPSKEAWDKNGLFSHKFEYSSQKGWNCNLKPGNKAIDAGRVINNFAEKFMGTAPDLGACEEGIWFIHVGPHSSETIGKQAQPIIR